MTRVEAKAALASVVFVLLIWQWQCVYWNRSSLLDISSSIVRFDIICLLVSGWVLLLYWKIRKTTFNTFLLEYLVQVCALHAIYTVCSCFYCCYYVRMCIIPLWKFYGLRIQSMMYKYNIFAVHQQPNGTTINKLLWEPNGFASSHSEILRNIVHMLHVWFKPGKAYIYSTLATLAFLLPGIIFSCTLHAFTSMHG